MVENLIIVFLLGVAAVLVCFGVAIEIWIRRSEAKDRRARL